MVITHDGNERLMRGTIWGESVTLLVMKPQYSCGIGCNGIERLVYFFQEMISGYFFPKGSSFRIVIEQLHRLQPNAGVVFTLWLRVLKQARPRLFRLLFFIYSVA